MNLHKINHKINSFDSSIDSFLEINTDTIIKNYQHIQKKINNTKVIPVLKSNAYGVGIVEVIKKFSHYGVQSFFVHSIDEILTIKDALKKNHLSPKFNVFHGLKSGFENLFTENSATPVLYNKETLHCWLTYTKKIEQKHPCILHFDIGMQRTGFPNYELDDILSHAKDLNIQFIMGHLSSTDNISDLHTSIELKRFLHIASYFPNIKKSLSNSCGIFLGNQFLFDYVRPGIGLYGFNNYGQKQILNCMKIWARILQIQNIKAESYIGYNHTFKAEKNMRIATISIGYAEGYPLELSNKGHIKLGDYKAPILGKVSMNTITVDITNIPEQEITEWTLIFDQEIMKEWSTVRSPYEFALKIPTSFKRIYL